jgi:hypothetical protein
MYTEKVEKVSEDCFEACLPIPEILAFYLCLVSEDSAV